MASHTQKLEQVILAIQGDNNAKRKSAQKAFETGKDNPELMYKSLTQLLVQSKHLEVRQFSGVMLRQYTEGELWGKLSPPTQNAVKKAALQLLGVEQTPLIRLGVAHLVGAIAVKCITVEVDGKKMSPTKTQNLWPELLPTLARAFQSSRGHYEAVFEVLNV
jgi:hypothetical protein